MDILAKTETLMEDTALEVVASGAVPYPMLAILRDGRQRGVVTLRKFTDKSDLLRALSEALELSASLDADALVFMVPAFVEVDGETRDALVFHRVTVYDIKSRVLDARTRTSVHGVRVDDPALELLTVFPRAARWDTPKVVAFLEHRGHFVITYGEEE